ncbi:MAG: cell division ATPase MinD [Methanoregulaceae archaeon]|nr:cell division ATPase MinD [Methanoregulaceae archaeon]
MVQVYTLASGKGGTGKTTLTVNLGTSLALLGKETFIMDADIGMANLGLILGLEDVPVTLHEVLAGKANVKDAIYEGPGGVKVIPSGISLQGFQQADPENLRDVMKDLVDRCEFLLIDAPAGISRDGVIPLAIADQVILVVNPELASIVDSLKIKILTEVVGGHVLGAILNRAGPDRSDLISQKMERVLGVKVIGTIPEDPNVRRAAASKTPVVIKFPESGSSIAIKRIAAELAGVAFKEPMKGEVTQDGFIDRFARVLFRSKT